MADSTVRLVALRSHTGSYGHVRKGQTFTATERQAKSLQSGRRPVAALESDAPKPAAAPPPKPGDAVDLREVPIKKLDAALAEVKDAALLRDMLASDDRSSARPKYEARIAELEA